jgi:hypothetical protein
MNSQHQISTFLAPALALFALMAAGQSFAAEDDHGKNHHALPHQHLSLFLGYALERKRSTEEEAGAIGLDYSYRYHENWAIAGFIEELASDTVRDASVGVLIKYHPVEGLALFAGPGYEFAEKHNAALLRIGAGYAFALPKKWTLGPELAYDMIEGGKRTYVLGIAIGREF